MKTIHPKSLRLVVFATDIDSDDVCKELHVCKYDFKNRIVTKTACGLGGVKEAYAFPFFESLWTNKETPICEACYQEVAGKINKDSWYR